jgi:hypothetical protein
LTAASLIERVIHAISIIKTTLPILLTLMISVGREVLTAVVMKISVFWGVMLLATCLDVEGCHQAAVHSLK